MMKRWQCQRAVDLIVNTNISQIAVASVTELTVSETLAVSEGIKWTRLSRVWQWPRFSAKIKFKICLISAVFFQGLDKAVWVIYGMSKRTGSRPNYLWKEYILEIQRRLKHHVSYKQR